MAFGFWLKTTASSLVDVVANALKVHVNNPVAITGPVEVEQSDPADLNATVTGTVGVTGPVEVEQSDPADLNATVRGEAEEGAVPSVGNRVPVAGVDPASGKAYTPWVDSAGRLHIVMEAGNTPVMDTLDCDAGVLVGNAVYNDNGTMKRTDAADSAKMPAVGFVLSKPDGTHAVVVFTGRCTSVGGLMVGAAYYIDIPAPNPGGITTTIPTIVGGFVELQRAGFADATGVLIVELGESYTL